MEYPNFIISSAFKDLISSQSSIPYNFPFPFLHPHSPYHRSDLNQIVALYIIKIIFLHG